MHKLVRQQLIHAWIALLGVLFSALAPTLSHAMAGGEGQGDQVQICTMDGMKLVSVSAASSDKSVPIDHVFTHCPYCATHGGAALPTTPVVHASFAPAASHPPLFYQSATPLFSWTAAAPRGPPRLA